MLIEWKRWSNAHAHKYSPRGNPLPEVGVALLKMELPQKKYYRQRAHSNPLADHNFDYPTDPDSMDWNKCYLSFKQGDKVGIY